MTFFILVLLGLCLGSFVNALVWRIYMQSKTKSAKAIQRFSISKGRSQCTSCKHRLSALDLIPVVSWLILRGKCRYCDRVISWQYPLVEALTAGLFVLSYAFWPREINGVEAGVFGLWLISVTGLVALAVYDIRWMLLPNRIIFPLYGVAGSILLLRIIQDGSARALGEAGLAVAIGGGIFYVLFQISNGSWIGGGDVKLGFLLGALLGSPMLAVLMLFLSSLLGSVSALPLVAAKKLKRSTRIPYGPYLIVAAIIAQLFGERLVAWYFAAVLGT